MALEEISFDNGLTAYVDHMPEAHTNTINVFVGYGSVQERSGEEGVAHALEHAVHAQTTLFPNRAALRDFARGHGIKTNANTYYTRTLYTASDLDPAASMQYLGQVVAQPTLPSDLVTDEMRAVLREAKTGLDDMKGLHSVAADYAMFGTPAGRRVIGYSDALDFTGDTLTTVFQRNYNLGNMTVIAAGNVTTQQIVDGVDAFFEDKYPLATSDPVLLTGSVGIPRTSGLVHPESRSVKFTQAVPLSEELRDDYANHYSVYGVALSALSEACFRKLRYEEGISYDGGIAVRDYNHPDAWCISGYVTTDADKLAVARRVFKEVFDAGASGFSDKKLIGELMVRRFGMLERIDSVEGRVDNHAYRLSRYAKPQDLETIADAVATLTVDDIRDKINAICDFFVTNPSFEHVTGNSNDISGVDEVIDVKQIA